MKYGIESVYPLALLASGYEGEVVPLRVTDGTVAARFLSTFPDSSVR